MNEVASSLRDAGFDAAELGGEIQCNEIVVFILNRESGVCPYSHEFVTSGQDPQLLSGLISAISSFMGELIGKNQRAWKTVYGSNATLIVEGGEWCLGVLAVQRETSEARSKLRRIVQEFEESFQLLRDMDHVRGTLFKEFDAYVRRVFTSDYISNRAIVIKPPDWREKLRELGRPSTVYKVTKTLLQSEDWNSIQEIAQHQKISINDAKEFVSRAFWNHAAKVISIPDGEDILSLSEGSSTLLFAKGNPYSLSHNLLRFLTKLDGRKTVTEILKELGIRENEELLLELGRLISNGFIQRIPLERRILLLNDCILSQFLQACANLVGSSTAKSYLDQAIDYLIDELPRVGTFSVRADSTLVYPLEADTTPTDLNDIYEGIDKVMDIISELLAAETRIDVEKEVLDPIRKRCHDKYGRYLSDVIL